MARMQVPGHPCHVGPTYIDPIIHLRYISLPFTYMFSSSHTSSMSTPDPVKSGSASLSVPPTRPPLAASAQGSESSLHRVQNLPGYTTPVFKGKEEQRALVEQEVANKACIVVVDPPLALTPYFDLGLHPSRARRRRGQLVLL